MFCLLVSPKLLRRALLLSNPEPPSTASYRAAVVGPSTPPPAASCHVAVDIPDGYDDEGDDSGVYKLETTTQHISPVSRVLAKAALVAYTAFAAPAFVVSAATRSSNWLQVLLVVVLVLLTFLSLFMATLCALEDEDREREEQGDDGLEVGTDS